MKEKKGILETMAIDMEEKIAEISEYKAYVREVEHYAPLYLHYLIDMDSLGGWSDELSDKIDDQIRAINVFLPELTIDMGETKIVFILRDHDFVLKIPRTNRDYCAREVNVYDHAVNDGYDDYFAFEEECGFVTIDGIEIPSYIMEYMDCEDEDELYYHSSEYLVNGESAGYGLDGEELVMDVFGNVYGWDILENLQLWLEVNFVNDLHEANVGWTNGQIKFIDYSGYGSIVKDECPILKLW